MTIAFASPVSIDQVQSVDILCGRDKISYNHNGNTRFRFIIACNLEQFKSSKSRREKGRVVNSIFKSIQMVGGRFLERDTCDKNLWFPASSKVSRLKISHALRDKYPYDTSDEAQLSLKSRISNYSLRKKEAITDAITCALLRVPLPARDLYSYNCVESILNDEVKSFLQKNTTLGNCHNCIDFDERKECINCLVSCGDTGAEQHLGVTFPDPKSNYYSNDISKEAHTDTKFEDNAVETLEASDSLLYEQKDIFSTILSSLLTMETNQIFHYCKIPHCIPQIGKFDTRYHISLDDFPLDCSICTTGGICTEIECLPDDFTAEEFDSLVASLDHVIHV